MSEQPPSWSDLNPQKPEPINSRFDEVCALVFSAGPGKELLSELRKRYFDSHFSPLAVEAALRVRSTEQRVVRDLEQACERGLAAKKRPAAPG